MIKLILASGSPRRRMLLEQVGIEYIVCPSQVEEKVCFSQPDKVVMSLAEQKAMDVAKTMLSQHKDYMVLGADTVVAYKGQILGKPKDYQDAKEMLTMLSGQSHQVYTGVCLVKEHGGQLISETFYEKTDVHFYPLNQAVIDWYVSTGEPEDKAGAYGIQGYGAVLVSEIVGDYNNVVGLPVARLWQYLYTEKNQIQE